MLGDELAKVRVAVAADKEDEEGGAGAEEDEAAGFGGWGGVGVGAIGGGAALLGVGVVEVVVAGGGVEDELRVDEGGWVGRVDDGYAVDGHNGAVVMVGVVGFALVEGGDAGELKEGVVEGGAGVVAVEVVDGADDGAVVVEEAAEVVG